jgi:phosphoadenosine phosphosulfate reductase
MKAALQFSGGKDSLALLFHLQALLPYIDVLMLDTGDMTEAAHENAQLAKQIAPNFHTIETDSVGYRQINGEPTSENWLNCCAANIWAPMNNYIQANGYRQIFRGTKSCDPYVHGVFPGDVVQGIVYTMPLWEWDDGDVRDYLGIKMPEPYLEGAKGMPDCVSCPVAEACGGKTRNMWRPWVNIKPANIF